MGNETGKNRERLHDVQEKLYELLSVESNEGMTLREIAPLIGVQSPNTVSHHIKQLEKKGYLFRDASTGKIRLLKSPVSDLVFLNLYGLAECGPTGFFVDDMVIDRVPLPSKTFQVTSDSFLVQASGDSMYPMISDGDLVLAEKNPVPENGDVVIVIHNGAAKIKKFFKERGKIILQSLNAAYPPIGVYSDADISIAGVVTGVVHKFESS